MAKDWQLDKAKAQCERQHHGVPGITRRPNEQLRDVGKEGAGIGMIFSCACCDLIYVKIVGSMSMRLTVRIG
jgi:hypothetical protein